MVSCSASRSSRVGRPGREEITARVRARVLTSFWKRSGLYVPDSSVDARRARLLPLAIGARGGGPGGAQQGFGLAPDLRRIGPEHEGGQRSEGLPGSFEVVAFGCRARHARRGPRRIAAGAGRFSVTMSSA